MNIARSMIVLGAAAWPWGCHRPANPSEPISQVFAVEHDDQTARLWEACVEVLRNNHFRLDRVDSRAGVITTFPVVSQHYVEFWRHDVDTAYDLLDATINPIRRSAEIRVVRDEPLGAAEVTVAVRKQRHVAPGRHFDNSAMALRFFRERSEIARGASAFDTVTGARVWLESGRDGAMERRLIGQISARLGNPSPAG